MMAPSRGFPIIMNSNGLHRKEMGRRYLLSSLVGLVFMHVRAFPLICSHLKKLFTFTYRDLSAIFKIPR